MKGPAARAFDLELLPNSGASGLRRLAQTLILDQAIAVPVGLVMAAVNGGVWNKLVIATLYSQCIGLLCHTVSQVTVPKMCAWPASGQRAMLMVQFFLCGVVGAEIAGALLVALYGDRFKAPRVIAWAIGATIAAMVALVLTTVRRLRTTVDERERELREREIGEARLLQAKSDAELAALQARINPHFLFNTLNSIAELIREDPARAEAMTLQLSSLFRYTLQAPQAGLVTLGEELLIVRRYLEIEQARFGPRLRYELDVPAALFGERVPALILQPLVENAIRHGISTAVDGGSVCIRGWVADGHVHLAVIDTGEGRANPGTGEGLENVRGRLRAAFGAQGVLTLERHAGQTEARLRFPALATVSA